jgi:hypothetical protein
VSIKVIVSIYIARTKGLEQKIHPRRPGSVRQRSQNPSRMAGWAARDGDRCVGWPVTRSFRHTEGPDVTGSRWNLESAAAWGCTGNYSTPYLFLRRSRPRHERGFGSSSAVNGERYRISWRDNERDIVSSVIIEKS